MSKPLSLRVRFVGFLALVLLPVALLGIIQGSIALFDQSQNIRNSFVESTLTVAKDQSAEFHRLLDVLSTLSDHRDITSGDNFLCREALIKSLQRLSHFSSIYALDQQGQSLCAVGEDLDVDQNISWFREIQQGAPFVISRYSALRKCDECIVFSVPIHRNRQFEGALAATLPISILRRFSREFNLRTENRGDLLDKDGNILTASIEELPLAEMPINYSTTIPDFLSSEKGTQIFEHKSEDGSQRLYALSPLLNDSLYLLISRPTQNILTISTLSIWLQIVIPIALWALAVSASWLATNQMVLRWINKSKKLAERLIAGNWSPTNEFDNAPSEFKLTADLYEDLISTIQSRQSALTKALEEKDTLIKEIHHRVKNNLQIITSLLELQGRTAQSDGERRILMDAQNRINALATIHRALYEAENLDVVGLRPFLQSLTTHLEELSSTDNRSIRVLVKAPDIIVSSNKAIPLALLTAEAATNAVKHAFSKEDDGKIMMTISPAPPTEGQTDGEELYNIEVVDAGTATIMSDHTESQNGGNNGQRPGIGKTLMQAFTRQLGAEMFIETTEKGTRVLIRNAHLHD